MTLYEKIKSIYPELTNRDFAFGTIILQNDLLGKRDKIINYLAHNEVVTRPIVAGNFTLKPVMKHLKFNPIPKLPNSNLIHNQGFFIGNHHFDVTKELKEVHSLLLDFEKENTKWKM